MATQSPKSSSDIAIIATLLCFSGATFAVIALSLEKPTAAVFSAIVAGACFGFLRHNFYPARIFMGDSGALLLGFVLATLAVQGLLKTAATVALFFPRDTAELHTIGINPFFNFGTGNISPNSASEICNAGSPTNTFCSPQRSTRLPSNRSC